MIPGVSSPVLVEHGPDAGVVWHYGDPFAEQRAWIEGRGLADLSNRGVIRVDGADRLAWLHSLTTQALEALPAGHSAESLVLSPNGHIEHALHLVDDGASTWITVEPQSSGALTAWLDSMRFLLRVEVSDVSAEWAVVAEPADTQSSVARDAISWVDPWPAVVDGSVAYGPTGALHPATTRWRVREVLVPRSKLGGLSSLVGLAYRHMGV